MKAICIFFLNLLSLQSFAQVSQPALLSLKGYGGNKTDRVIRNSIPTRDGGFIVCMDSDSPFGTGNIDSLCNTGGHRTIFLKYNADATTLEWVKCYPFVNNNDSVFFYLFPQSDGNNVLVGTFSNTGLLIAKHTPAYTPIWEKSYSRDSAGFKIKDVSQTKDGGYAIVGTTLRTDMNFPVHYGSWMYEDIAIIKLDSMGNKEWSKVYGGSQEDIPVKILETSQEDFYIIAGIASNDHDFPKPLGGQSDILLLKLDSSGNQLWHRNLGGSKYEGAGYACSNGKDGVIIVGQTESTDGDVHHSIKPWNIWAVEVDSSNIIVWDNCYGGGSYEYPRSICKATDGSIWIAAISDKAGNQVFPSYGGGDAFFVHADSMGNFLSAKVMGSTGFGKDEAWMVNPLPDGKVIVGGFYGKNDGAFASLPSFSTAIYADAFLAIFSPWTTFVNETESNQKLFTLYPNPVQGILHVEVKNNDLYVLTIQDNAGKQIYQYQGKGSQEIDTKSWAKGIYHATYGTKSNISFTQNFVVN